MDNANFYIQKASFSFLQPKKKNLHDKKKKMHFPIWLSFDYLPCIGNKDQKLLSTRKSLKKGNKKGEKNK